MPAPLSRILLTQAYYSVPSSAYFEVSIGLPGCEGPQICGVKLQRTGLIYLEGNAMVDCRC